MLDAKLLEMLVCPVTHDRLRQEGDWLVGVRWGVRYPVREGIPILLAEQAALPQGVGSVEELRARAAAPRQQGG